MQPESDADTLPALGVKGAPVDSASFCISSCRPPLVSLLSPSARCCCVTGRSLFHLFHCYLGIVSEESSAFSCFVPTKTDTLSWCCKSSQPSGSIKSIVTGNLNTWVIFFPFFITMCDIFALEKVVWYVEFIICAKLYLSQKPKECHCMQRQKLLYHKHEHTWF